MSAPGSPGHVWSNVRTECYACNIRIKATLLDSDLFIAEPAADPGQLSFVLIQSEGGGKVAKSLSVLTCRLIQPPRQIPYSEPRTPAVKQPSNIRRRAE